MMSYILKYDMPLDEGMVGEAKTRWKEMYGGWQNWDEVGILDRGASVERLGMTFEEMGFQGLDERNESRILGPLGVPPILIGSRIGLERSTYANYEEARRAFWEDTMMAELGLIENELQFYLQLHNGFVKFDYSNVPALRKDIPGSVTAFASLVQNGVTKGKAAEITGLEIGELPDLDVVYMPMSLVPINAPSQTPVLPATVSTTTETPRESTATQTEQLPEAEEQAEEGERTKVLQALTMELKRANDLMEKG